MEPARAAQRRPVRPDPRHGGRGQPAAADRHRADRPQGPQGRLRRGARGAAVPRRRHGLPAPGLGAGPPARPLVGDVRADRRRGRRARRHEGHGPGGRGDPRQPLLPARRGAGRQAHRATPHPKLPGRPAGRHQLAGPLAADAARASGGRDRRRRWSAVPRGGDRRARTPSGRPSGGTGTCAAGSRDGSRPSSWSARSTKSCVIFSLGRELEQRAALVAGLDQERPPDRICAYAGMPTARSMSSSLMPLLARFTTSDSRSRMPSSSAISRSLTTARMAGRSGVTGTRIRSARSKIARLSGLYDGCRSTMT